jgi:hypothetical protein
MYPFPGDTLVIMHLRFRSIQAGLLLFWSVWMALVGATNLLDGLKRLDVLPDGWTLASGNYALVAGAVGAHGVPAGITAALFVGLVSWQLFAAGLFWRAFRVFRRAGSGLAEEVTHAFAVSLALWAAFLFATEATTADLTAHSHMGIFIAQLVSLLVLRSAEADTRVRAEPTARVASGASSASGIRFEG